MQVNGVPGGTVKEMAKQLVQAALKARQEVAEQNTIKATAPGKGGKINTVV